MALSAEQVAALEQSKLDVTAWVEAEQKKIDDQVAYLKRLPKSSDRVRSSAETEALDAAIALLESLLAG